MSDARISYLELDEASDQVKQVYSAVESNFGQVLNLIKIAGHSPPALNGMMSLFGSLQKCSLKDHLRELAYLKVSHVNECEYWLTHHSASGREAGLSDEQIDSLGQPDADCFDPVERLILEFAAQLTRTTHVDQEIVERLSEQLSEEELVELALTVGVANLTNRFNHAFEIPLED